MTIAVALTKNVLCNAYATIAGTNVAYVSVHTQNPNNTGASEATGGTPAYVRKPTTWGGATNGQVVGTPVTIDLPVGTYTYVGLWRTVSGGSADFIDAVAIGQTQFNGQGQLIVTPSFTVN
ncbi:hypothetical protein [Streptomyces sp. NPDC059071]|uniref:hypothetical protein n=1 Tax=Streptomyces sp. NPDC059071 TaxID=3346714 RepID=UPI003692ADFF